MGDGIIDLTRYLTREPEGEELPRGAMALWGADGERSRFALPLWRIIYLAQADRGMIVSQVEDGAADPEPFVALDLSQDPARTDVPLAIPTFDDDDSEGLVDLLGDGLIVFLGRRAGRVWCMAVDGGGRRAEPLAPRTREDILFLAGECAGLLFLRDLADDVAGAEPQPDPSE